MHNFRFGIKKIFISLIIGLIIFSLFSQFFTKAEAAIGINRQINFQGKLVNNPSSTNVTDTSYTIVFTLYDNASGATQLWQESQTVTTVDGIFRVALGSVTAFPANFNFNWSGLYLGIKVDSDDEMTPRIQMAAVPFAFNAEKVSGLTVQDTSGNASTSGTLQIANAKTINLGTQNLTFTTSGDTTLTLPTTGTLATLAGIEDLTNKTIGSTGLSFSGATTDITTVTNEDFVISPNGSGLIGLNTTSPLVTFDLRANSVLGGTLAVASISGTTSFAGLVVNNDGVGDIFTASKSGLSLFTVKNNGQLVVGAPYYTATCTLKTDNTGLITCGSDNAGSGSSPFAEITGGLIVANNSTVDLLIGGQSTASATFHVFGSNALAGTQPVASIAANTSFAALVTDNQGVGDLFTASSSGLPIFTITKVGNLLPGLDNALDIGSSTRGFRTVYGNTYYSGATIGVTASLGCVSSTLGIVTGSGICPISNIDTFWNQTNGALFPNNSTVDLLIGGQSTSSATFHVFGSNELAGTQPVASIAANTSFAALVIDQKGVGDLFTASASGGTRFTVDRGGNINATGNASVAGALTFRTNGGGEIQTSSNQGLTIGGNTTGSITIAPNNGTGVVTIGTSTNGLTFDITNSGPVYTGTARPTKKITLNAEYPGAILTASGSATITGSMTSDASPSAALSNWRTYYEWSSSTASPLQDYTIVVRVKLPEDFSAWATTNAITISYNTELSGSGSNKMDVVIYNADTSLSAANQSTPVVMRTDNISASDNTWLDLSIDDSDLNDNGNALDAAGDTAVIYLKLYSMDNNHVQVGDIVLSYLSKF